MNGPKYNQEKRSAQINGGVTLTYVHNSDHHDPDVVTLKTLGGDTATISCVSAEAANEMFEAFEGLGGLQIGTYKPRPANEN